MRNVCVLAAWILLGLLLQAPSGLAADAPWRADAREEARRDGYHLIDTPGLAELVTDEAEVLIIDARADYEFAAGHIPGAVNLEFDLGDRLTLSDEKRAAFEALVGSDRKRRLVIYCRSFR